MAFVKSQAKPRGHYNQEPLKGIGVLGTGEKGDFDFDTFQNGLKLLNLKKKQIETANTGTTPRGTNFIS